jgi:hypothetical protein
MDELNSTKLTQIKVMDPDRLTDGDEISAAQAAGIHFEAQLQTSRILLKYNSFPYSYRTWGFVT